MKAIFEVMVLEKYEKQNKNGEYINLKLLNDTSIIYAVVFDSELVERFKSINVKDEILVYINFYQKGKYINYIVEEVR